MAANSIEFALLVSIVEIKLGLNKRIPKNNKILLIKFI